MRQADLLVLDPEPCGTSGFMPCETEGTGSPWGDGFADDGWTPIAAVTHWDACSSDEYVRFFPHLRFWAATPDTFVVDHLVRRSRASVDAEARSMLRCVLEGLSEGSVPEIAPVSSAAFAFHAGLHPAYLWPIAVCTAERDTVAGWLGLLCRGRAVLMPPDVAEYLLDAIVGDEPMIVLRDPVLGALVDRRDLGRLRESARRRVAGSETVCRLRRRAVAPWFAFASRSGLA